MSEIPVYCAEFVNPLDLQTSDWFKEFMQNISETNHRLRAPYASFDPIVKVSRKVSVNKLLQLNHPPQNFVNSVDLPVYNV